MMKLIVWLGVILALAGCMVSDVRAPTLEDRTPAMHIENSTIALVKQDSEKEWYAYCAGVWLNETTILTAAHCVESAGEPEKLDLSILSDPLGLMTSKPEGEEWNPLGYPVNYMIDSDVDADGPRAGVSGRIATVASIDESIDLALLKVVAPPEHSVVAINRNPLPSGMNVICTGHTVGLWWTYSYGRIAATRVTTNPDERKIKTLQISIPIWKGNSGGGAFDEEGHLIGIASFINTMGPNLSFFVHRDLIVQFIERSRDRPLLRH